MARACVLSVALLACAGSAFGQVVNPTTVTFNPSPDHDAISSDGAPVVSFYVLRLYVDGQAQAFAEFGLGKPMPVGGTITVIDPSWFVLADPGMICVARVGAEGPGGVGLSEPSNTWVRNTSLQAPDKPLGGFITLKGWATP